MAVALSSILHQRSSWRLAVIFTAMLFTRASFLKPVIKMGVVVITRLRKDAVLYAELKQPQKRKRGRPCKYGKRIKLTNIINSSDGWFEVRTFLYGKEEIKEVKVFKALYEPAGCLVVVLVVRESKDCFRAFYVY
jgi:hypothetical protein